MPDSTLQKSIQVALESRALARTFRTSVGVAIETYDGEIFGGFNIETYPQKGWHAEEVALIKGLAQGYNATDFRRCVVLFQHADSKESPIYPGCPSCWEYYWEFTHPYFTFVNVDERGEIVYSARLNEILHPPKPGLIYPANITRKIRPKQNFLPKLPLNPELKEFYENDLEFRELCDDILKVKLGF